MDVNALVLEVVRTVCHQPHIEEDAELLSEGLIDSLGIVTLLLALETKTGIHIPLTALDPDDGFSARSLARLLSQYSQ